MIIGDFVPEEHHLFCTVHKEPFIRCSPRSLHRAVQCFNRWAKNDMMLEIETNGFVLALPSVLTQKPFCCRLEPGKLLDLYLFSEIGRTDECVVCHHVKQGTKYRRLRKSSNLIQILKHLCFECLVFRAVPNEQLKEDMK